MLRPWLAALVLLAASAVIGAVVYAQLSDSQAASGVINAAPGEATATTAPTSTPCPDFDADSMCDAVDADDDNDGCPDLRELATGLGAQNSGGNRDPLNPWDYFNPTHDGQNRVDDILAVVAQYFVDQANVNYTQDTDRTLVGPNAWNLGPPDGFQRVADILNIVRQYYHDCA